MQQNDEKLLHILQHALGRDEYGRRKPGRTDDYRNHYVECEGSDTIVHCREAVDQGLMTEHPPSDITGGGPWFRVTDAGKEYIETNSPKPPKLSRGKQRYLRFLDESDATNETFGEWLKRTSAEAKESTARGRLCLTQVN